MGETSGKFSCVDGFAEELDELFYGGVSNWFVSFRSLFTIYSAHFSYFVVFFVSIACGLLSHRHSLENGRKFTQFWWGALIHGVVSERGFTAAKYWHAQAPVMFFGKQLPLHIVFLYPSILYVAMMAVQRLKLNICTEPAAVGLIAMLMEIPFRMISVKFLHITYHDSEPLYYNKLCGIPWVEIFSSLVMGSSYVAVYHVGKLYQSGDLCTVWDKSNPSKKETITTVLSGISSPMLGFLQKVLFLHVLNDLFNVNPVSCLFLAVSLYLSFVVCFEPKKAPRCIVEETDGKSFLFYQILLYVSCIMFLALLGRPQNEISIGVHEPIGDCTMLVSSRTPLGKPLKPKKYLCADEVAARRNFVYNFDCLEEGPPCLHAIWYTICGSPICNRPQFFVNVLSFVILLCTLFYKTLFMDSIQLDAVKRLIPRYQGGFEWRTRTVRPVVRREEEPEPTEEMTVGFLLLQNDIELPSGEDENGEEKSN